MNKEHFARPGHVFAIGIDCGGLHVGKGFAEVYSILNGTVFVPSSFEEAPLPTGKQPAARIELGPLLIELCRFLVSEVPRRVWMDLDASLLAAAATLIAETEFNSGSAPLPSMSIGNKVLLVSIQARNGAVFSIYARKVETTTIGEASLSGAFGRTTFLGRGGEGYCSLPVAEPYIVKGDSIKAEAVLEEPWMCISEGDIRAVQSWLIYFRQDFTDDGFTRL